MRLRQLLFSLFLAILTLGSDLEITWRHLWYPYPWLDIPMHLLGGFAVGSFLLALFGRRVWPFVLLMTAVAVGWEIFEYVSGITAGELGYWLDTGHDLLDDALGALAAYYVARKAPWR